MTRYSARFGGISREARGGLSFVFALALLLFGWIAPEPAGRLVYWPLLALMPPAFNIGTAEDPIYEATPIHILAVPVGLVATLLFWACGTFVILQRIARPRS